MWEPAGEPLIDIVQSLVKVNAEIARALCAELHQREGGWKLISDGGEPRYRVDTFHFESGPFPDFIRHFAFQEFEHRLRYQARFFHPESRDLLKSVFEGVGNLVSRKAAPVSVGVSPGSDYSVLYRARVFQSDAPLKRALIAPERELGPPPADIAAAGRMNAAHVAVFYGATSIETALAEVRPPAHSRVLIGRFEVQRNLRLLDVGALEQVVVQGSPFDPKHRDRVRHADFLRLVSARMSRPILPDHQTGEYLVTQAIADYLAYECEPRFDGMIYPSTQSDAGANVVLFHDASRVEPWLVPASSFMEADLTVQTDEGPEPDYDVVEWTNDPRASQLSTQHSPIDADESTRQDDRPITLQLIESSLKVLHPRKVSYDATTYSVSRRKHDSSEMNEF